MKPLWTPDAARVASANMTLFIKACGNPAVHDYASLYQWSSDAPEDFWSRLWDFCEVIGTKGARVMIQDPLFRKCRFFPDASLNYAQNLLRPRADGDALVFWAEDHTKSRMTFQELCDQTAAFAAYLKACGVARGDRVAGVMPNCPRTIVAMLATASLGAVWSSCSPDFGVQGILDRFQQIAPKVLIAPEAYIYNGKLCDVSEKIQAVRAQLSSVTHFVGAGYLRSDDDFSNIIKQYAGAPLCFESVPFDHPLFILFSSGTTGVPKCIVHGHGGTLLQHLKEHQLHCDIKPHDRVFYYTTCGWMMWNWLTSALASKATLMLYDGAPMAPHDNLLFDYIQAERITFFGTSAKYLDSLRKMNLTPRTTHDLSTLRMIASTGSPLVAEGFAYVYAHIAPDICLASISGGTDILSCFALGNPIAPVWAGELQTPGLGMCVDVFNSAGQSVPEEKGELVCAKPFPSMPVGFWNDPGDVKYQAAYFERFPGAWHHGDFVSWTPHGGLIIYGRSDAVLNPGGVRIGTAEIYRQVEQVPEVLESIAVGQEWEGDVRVVLFVRLREGLILTPELTDQIKKTIRQNTTPRHVPAKVIQVNDIPRTISGKIVELAVSNAIHNRPIVNTESLANPEALGLFRNIRELQG